MSKQPEFFKDGKYVGYPRVESVEITDDVRKEVVTAREKSYQEEGGDLRKLYKAGLASQWREVATPAENEVYRQQVQIEKNEIDKHLPADTLELKRQEFDTHRKRVEIEKGLSAIFDKRHGAETFRVEKINSSIENYRSTLHERLQIPDDIDYSEISEELREKLAIRDEQLARYIKDTKFFSDFSLADETRREERLKALDLMNQYAELKFSDEGYYPMHYLRLQKYQESLEAGRLIEVPSVKQDADELRRKIADGQPVFIVGDQGSGKTDLAKTVAREFGTKEPYLVSMRHDMDLGDVVGRHQIEVIAKIIAEERESFIQRKVEEVNERIDNWKKAHPEKTELDLETQTAIGLFRDAGKSDYQAELEAHVETKFILGQMYRAMEEGVPFILDEANAAPHDVLIALNDYLTRRPGDVIRVQQDGGREITIKKGFAFVLTGNEGEKYKRGDGRGMDPAFLSRLHRIDYDYPRQTTDVTYQQYLEFKAKESQLTFEERKKQPEIQVEMFEILTAMLMETDGTVNLPPSEFENVFNLARVARLLQDNYSGRQIDASLYKGVGARQYNLKKSVPSIRNLISVIADWKADGYLRPLDYFLYQNFIAQAEVPEDRVFLISVFRDCGNFFTDEALFPENGTIAALEDKDRMNKNYELDVSLLREIGTNDPDAMSFAAQDLERSLLIKQDTIKQSGVVTIVGPHLLVDAVYGKGPDATHYGSKILDERKEVKPDRENNSRESLLTEKELEEILSEGNDRRSKLESVLAKLDEIIGLECSVA